MTAKGRLGREALPALLLLLYAFACVFVWTDDAWRQGWDSALYVLTARSLAAGEGYTYLGEPFFLRPPGLSWLIAAIQGTGPFDPVPLNRLMGVFAATTAGAVYFAFRPQHGRAPALAVALLSGTAPLMVARFNWVLSELPFLTLLFLAIGLAARAPQARRPARAWGASALCLVGAFYLRSAAAVALPGLAWAAWRAAARRGAGRPRPRDVGRALLPVAIAAGLCLPWAIYQRTAAAGARTPSEQLMLFDYGTALLRIDPSDPDSDRVSLGEWASRVRDNATATVSVLSRSTLVGDGVAAGVVLAVLVLGGAARTARRGASLAEWVALGYALLLLFYFTHKPRIAVPLVPFVYAYALAGLSGGLEGLAARAGRRLAAPAAALALALPLGIANVVRLPDHLDPRRNAEGETPRGARWRDRAAAGRWLRENTPPDAVLLAGDAPVLSLLSERRTYSFHFARRPGLLERHGIGYVVLAPWDGNAAGFARRAAARARREWVVPDTGASARTGSPAARRSYVVYEIDPGGAPPGAR